ncbi:exocyst subunit exo70 family protein C2 [Actinidia rufa]|uniref:Exocyst subunit Exo70 family protein n=1 Tax=Actinidia rufa TaxID=165716 RepID=A0A7J0EL00_9ERIC|nr:exocyst subunit exo70 family protein C2 [Actinidia rufa]
METQRDKHLPENSPSFASRDAAQDNQDHPNPNPNPNPNLNPDQDHHQSNDDNNTENPESSTKAESNSENTEAENKEEEATEVNIEESPPPPDFSEVCEEIDQFISALSSPKCQESDPPDVPKVVEQFAFLIEAKMANYDLTESPMKWNQLSDEDSSSFLEAVDRVSKLTMSLTAFSSESKYNSSINRIGCILQRAMSYLEDEFKSLLESPKIPDSPSSHSNQTDDQSASQESNTTGDNNFLGYSEEGFKNLVSTKFRRCNGNCWRKRSIRGKKTFKQVAAVHFARERKLSEAMFTDRGSLKDGLFSSLIRGIMIQLLNFAQAVAMTKRSSEKLFKFLDVYETLRDVVPSMDDLFPEEIGNEIKSEASLTRSRLGESTVFIFCELENSIKADTGKMTVPGGAVHPLTRYTMNYLKYACEYKDTLEQIFREHQKIERADSGTGSDYDYNSQCGQNHNNHKVQQSPFALQINKVMDLLDTSLETKSKLYKDTSLSSIFMMNNGRYILQKIKGAAEINDLMGDTWSRKRSSDLRQYHKTYQRETWGKLLSCLKHEGLSVNGKVVKPVLKEKFKSFNAMFDDIHRTQSTWVVSDEQLQSELRVSISAVIIPAYRSFLARFSQTFTPGRQTEKYVKHQPEDIETYIEELFDGNTMATGRRRP